MTFFESAFVWFGVIYVASFLVIIVYDCVTSCANCDKQFFFLSRKCPYCKTSREL